MSEEQLYALIQNHTAHDEQVLRQIAEDIGELKGLMKGVADGQGALVTAMADQEVRLRTVETKVARIYVVGPLTAFVIAAVGVAFTWIKGVKI